MASSSSRFFFLLIVVAAAGYLVYTRYFEKPPTETFDSETVTSETASSPGSATPTPAAVTATPAPVKKNLAPPGVFFMVDRVSTTTDDGVIALVPGDRVTLLDRRTDGTLKVTNGQLDFTVRENQVTQDLDRVKEIISKRPPARPPQ